MAIDSRYKLKTGEEVAYFPPIQNTGNPYLTEAAMHLDQANQLEGYGYLVDGVGAFAYLGSLAGTAADYEGFVSIERFNKIESVLDIDEVINEIRNLTLRNNGEISSGLYMYDNPTTEIFYQFIRYNASTNFIEFGSNDGQGEVISAKIDRGKADWEFQDRIQILKPGRGVNFLTPSVTDLDGNAFVNKYELRVNEGGVLELWTLLNTQALDALVWSSADITAKKASATFDLSDLGSYADDAAANTGGVAIGFAYINSSTGAMHRRLT